MISWFSFLLLGLATFRLTRLIVFDKITEFIRRPFHLIEEEMHEDGSVEEVIHIKGSGVRKFIGELLSCHWCTGVWSAVVLYSGYSLFPQIAVPVIVVLAIAGGAAIIQVMVDYFIF